ncbi:MAG: FeoB small GTPase domain-containing protein [Bacteroidota bacterium]
MANFNYVIALAGNPNTGKSTVFNNLTGLRQHTGNWPGKTVSRAEGGFAYNDSRYKLVDLPGTYSLLSTSTDEQVARDFILFGQPDVTIIVVDATRLERNLNLVLQVLEITDRAVLCLNLMDEVRRYKLKIDVRALSRDLGIPVVPAEARQKVGMPELLNYVDQVAKGVYKCKAYRFKNLPANVENAVNKISAQLSESYPNIPNSRWVALRLLEGDQSIIDAVTSGDLGKIIQSEMGKEPILVQE